MNWRSRYLSVAAGACIGIGALTGFLAAREYSLFHSIVKAEIGVPYEEAPEKKRSSISEAQYWRLPLPVRLNNAVYRLLARRGTVFSGRPYSSFETIYQSGVHHLMTGQGACGAFSWVLTELLHVAGYQARLTKLKCVDGSICHSVVEVKYEGRWLLLDPVQNLIFVNPDGSVASLSDLASGMPVPFLTLEDRAQKPWLLTDYKRYKLEDSSIVRTNWLKVPLVGRLVQELIRRTPIEEIRNVSMRSYFLNNHLVVSAVTSAVGTFLLLAQYLTGPGSRFESKRMRIAVASLCSRRNKVHPAS